jgi:hypothetical protein
MAMRGYFFLNMWAEYIENAGQLYDSILLFPKTLFLHKVLKFLLA